MPQFSPTDAVKYRYEASEVETANDSASEPDKFDLKEITHESQH